jgi:hypothetical protein
MSKEENIIDFECPHCTKNNSIKFTKKIECKSCDKSIMGSIKTHKTSKPKLIFTALASVAVGAIAADKHVAIDEMIILASSGLGTAIYMSRLKIETEYKIMKTCINEFESNIKTRDTCFCVVKKLNNYINPLIVKIKGEDWVLGQIDTQYNKCKEPELLSNQTKN